MGVWSRTARDGDDISMVTSIEWDTEPYGTSIEWDTVSNEGNTYRMKGYSRG